MHTPFKIFVFACLALGSPLAAQTLVSYWNFEDDLLDRASAGAISDNGTWVGTPAFSATSPLGKGLLLDGSNFVTVPASTDVDGFVGNYSLTGWFRADQWNTGSQVILSKGAGNYGVERADSSDSLRFVDGSGNPIGGSVNDGVWHHFAAVSESGEISQLFIDGELAGTGAAAEFADSGGRLGIGNIPGAANRGWKGTIDEIGIFHDELSNLQAKAISVGIRHSATIFPRSCNSSPCTRPERAAIPFSSGAGLGSMPLPIPAALPISSVSGPTSAESCRVPDPRFRASNRHPISSQPAVPAR